MTLKHRKDTIIRLARAPIHFRYGSVSKKAGNFESLLHLLAKSHEFNALEKPFYHPIFLILVSSTIHVS